MLFVKNEGFREYQDLLAIEYYFSNLPKEAMDIYSFKPDIFKYWFGD